MNTIENMDSILDRSVHELENLASLNVTVKEFIKYSKKYSIAKYMWGSERENLSDEKRANYLLHVVDFTMKYFSSKKCYPDKCTLCIGNILFVE